jgi:hypothetical protein
LGKEIQGITEAHAFHGSTCFPQLPLSPLLQLELDINAHSVPKIASSRAIALSRFDCGIIFAFFIQGVREVGK